MASMLGLLLQIALIGGLVYFGIRLFRGWSAARTGAPAYAGASPRGGLQRMIDAPMARSTAGAVGGGAAAAAAVGSVGLAITEQDYGAFEQSLGQIQAAFSEGDLGRLRGLVTPEMLGYFTEQLSANASRGVENKVEAVKLEQGDLAEAWSEGDLDYATVAMRFSLVDYTRRIADGRIVEGNPDVRTEATEIWTFLRSRGGSWILSAIQQA
jgi:predicted lipid-binding transport protein (Tim44 family)